jgi:hypothetical protein
LTEWSGTPLQAIREYIYAGPRVVASVTPPAGITPGPGGPGDPGGPGGPGNPGGQFTVRITSPIDNTEFQQPFALQIDATATHPSGITSVQFLMDGVALGAADTTAPYSASTNITLEPWEYTRIFRFVAVATNGDGATLASEAVGIIVKRIGQLTGVQIIPNPVGPGLSATLRITGLNPCSTVGIRDGRPAPDGSPNGEISLNGGEMPYDITWNFLDYGDKTVTVRGQGNCVGQITQTVEVRPNNYAPVAVMATPVNGAMFPVNGTIALQATASDRPGWNGGDQITKVQFWTGSTLIGEDTTEPYQATYSFAQKGTHQIFARAIDNLGLAGDSAPITVNIVSLSSLTVSSPVFAGVPAFITVTGANPCGAVRLDYGHGDPSFQDHPISGLPMTVQHTWPAVGTYTLTAKGQGAACDDGGVLSTQVVVEEPNSLPSVALTSPAPNTGFAPHPNITLTATASDTDGTIARVQFFANGQPLEFPGDTTAPYEYVWSDAPNGHHTLFARAYDNRGHHTDSAPVLITVQHLTGLSITRANVGPPVFDATSHHGVVNNTLTFQHTVGNGPNRYLVVGLNAWKVGNAPTVTGVTYAGVAMSRIGRQAAVSEGRAVELWGLVAPPTGQAHVVVSTVDAAELTAGAHSWFNVDQTTPTGAPVGAQADTVTIASTTNEVVVDVFGYYAPTPTIGAGQTRLWADDMTIDGSAASYEAGAPTVTMSWSSGTQQPVILAVALKPTAAGGGGEGISVAQLATITVTAVEPCEGVVIDFGDGSSPVPLSQQPFVTTHAWSSPGVKTVTATGQGSCTGFLARTVEVLPNQPPTVALTAPADGATFSAGSTIYLEATASDSDDSVASVVFSSGATHIGTDETGPSPYTAQWVNVQPGTHTLTATAFDTAGGSSTSSRTVTVTHLKGVTISPSTVYVGQNATITVDYVAAGCGAIGIDAGPDASNGGVEEVIPIQSPPQVVSVTRQWSSPGVKTITVRGHATCTGILMPTITVNPNNPPTVALTAPANGATVQAPGPVTVSANASDSDGGINRVVFYANDVPIDTDYTAPYSVNWSGFEAGSYTLKAVAFDNFEASTTSATRSVSATYIGSITASPSSLVTGQYATITVNYSAGCGAIGINADDGLGEQVHTLQPPYAPLVVQKKWDTGGTKTITARGHGAPCANGDVTTTVTVTGNTAPTVALTAPANGATVQAPGPVTVSANASDSDGINRVVFYANDAVIDTDYSSPYSVTWSGFAAGNYTLKAVAFDIYEGSATSALVAVNASYIGSVTASPSTVVTGQGSTITVNYAAGCGAIGINADDGLGEQVHTLQPPYAPLTVTKSWSTTGTKTISVRGHGAPCAEGIRTTTVTVNTNTLPTVSITSPANGANVLAPGPVTVTANASDSHGIQKVEFLADGVVFDTDTSSPYSGNWTSIAGGAHTLTAKAYDIYGAVTTSAGISVNAGHLTGISVSPNPIVAGVSGTITVTGSSSCANVTINFGDGTQNQTLAQQLPATTTHSWASAGQKTVTATGVFPCAGTVSTTLTVNGNTAPSVTLTSPANGASYQAPGSIYLAANASDAQGINRVEFRYGSGLIFTDTVAPYEYTWSSVPAGTYHVFAIAYDQLGASTQTGSATITVNNGVLGGISASWPRRQGDNITFTVSGSNPCGGIAFNFGDGVAYTQAVSSLPWNEGHVYATGGWKTITATGQGNCTGTVSTQIYVDAKPTATLTSPSNGQTYLAPGVITANVTATDDGAIDRVEFYLNGGHWSTDSNGAPYQLTLTSVGAGTYTLFARAYDNAGSMTQTTTATVTVNNPGPSMVTSVEISPSPVGVNQSANVIVHGSNPCGAVELNFGDGSVVQTYPITQLPAYFAHTWTTTGPKTVTAIGHGNCSGQTSTVVTVQ